jgi:hypothetical protein
VNRDISIADKYGPAMTIETQADADAYFEELVAHSMAFGHAREEAEAIERKSLGYYAGYFDADTRVRVERLFQCEHPFFGKIAERGQPTPEAAYDLGFLRAMKITPTTRNERSQHHATSASHEAPPPSTP